MPTNEMNENNYGNTATFNVSSSYKNSCFPMQSEQMVNLVRSRDMHQNFNLCKIRRMLAATWTKFSFTHWLQHLANSVLASNHEIQQR